MIIFRRESLAKHTPSREIMGIERVHTANLLEVWLLDNLSFAVHIENTLYPMYLMRFYSLKKQLNQAALDIVFQSRVLNKITTDSSHSGYLLEQQIVRLSVMLNKVKKLALVSVLYDLRDILESKTTGCSSK